MSLWRWLIWVVPVAAVSLWIADTLLSYWLPANDLEVKAFDWQSQLAPHPKGAAPVIIEIDADTNAALGMEPGLAPVPRSTWTKLIAQLDEAGALVLVFDLTFGAETPHDAGLAQAIEETKRMAVVMATSIEEEEESDEEPDGYRYYFAPHAIGSLVATDKRYVGTNLALETDSGIQSVIPFYTDYATGERMYQISVLAALALRQISPGECETTPDETSMTCGSLTWELHGNRDITLRWSPTMEDFHRVPLQSALADLEKGKGEWAKGKVVLVGDMRNTADIANLAGVGDRPGPYAIADKIRALLVPITQQMKSVPLNTDRGIALVLAVLAGLLVWIFPPRGALLAIPLLFALVPAYNYLGARYLNTASATILPLLTIFFSLVVLFAAIAFVGWPQRHHRRESRLLCALFTYLRGSTPLLLKIGKEKFQQLKEDVHQAGEKAVASEGGVLERSTGDGFMATFDLASADAGVMAALSAAQKFTAAVEALGPAYGEDLRVGCGIECGQVSGVYLREDQRMAWSSTGATINLAERLQGLAGRLGESLLIGPTAAALLREKVPTESLGEHEMKGFDERVTVYRPAPGGGESP